MQEAIDACSAARGGVGADRESACGGAAAGDCALRLSGAGRTRGLRRRSRYGGESLPDILNSLGRGGLQRWGGKAWAAEALRAPLLERTGTTLEIPLSSYREVARRPAARDARRDRSRLGCARRMIRRSARDVSALGASKPAMCSSPLQPDRGSAAGHKAGYHDLASPPRHAYVAFYAHLREQQRIHALVHLGTHGTLEWLPGKALALSDACAPQALLGPLPVVYPFIVNNPGEAGAGEAAHQRRHDRASDAAAVGSGIARAASRARRPDRGICRGGRRGPAALSFAGSRDRGTRLALGSCQGLRARSKRTRRARPSPSCDAQLCDIKELAIRDKLHVFGRPPDAESRAGAGAVIAVGWRIERGQRASSGGTDPKRRRRSERAALLAALDGRRVAPGPAGAPTRGRADVLPTGRNFTTMDPRAIPTRTAAIVGARAASEMVRRYLQDHGDYPKAIVLDLWASASLRTGGDDLAQALAYLGVRPTWDAGSQRVTGVEVIPAPKLDRPRIDVTLRISGLFRDIFASQIALFDMAVGLVAGLDEEEAWNPLAAAGRRGESLDRVFGAAPGVYGAGAAKIALDGEVSDQDAIGAAYLESSRVLLRASATRRRRQASSTAAAFWRSDAHVHVQDDRECDLLSGDGVADFSGGYAARRCARGEAGFSISP